MKANSWEKWTEKQSTHTFQGAAEGKRTMLVWLRVQGGWTTWKKGINKITGSLRLEKASRIMKPKIVKCTIYCSELPADFPSSSQGSFGAAWRGGITASVLGCPSPGSTFTPSDRCHGQSEPRACWHPPSSCCGKAPSLGRKRKSALNPCISKEVSGKNTSPARMLSNFFFFFPFK